jgi:hypothetical protein
LAAASRDSFSESDASKNAAEAGGMFRKLLRKIDIHPPIFVSYLRVLLQMDLRGQHYGQSTGSPPKAVLTPLFWVVGQYLAVSMLLCALLYARVDLHFFAFANLTCALLMLFSAVIVEFNEAVLDPSDPEIIGHHPFPQRTYAAARFVNLLFYVGLMTLSLTVFPSIVGAGDRQGGLLFLPAYGIASLLLGVCTAGITIIVYTMSTNQQTMEGLKKALSWVQIVLILVLFYGGQAMLRSGSSGLAYVAADPPAYLRYLPSWWLAQWVAAVATAPGPQHLLQLLLGVGIAAIVTSLAVYRLSRACTMMAGSRGGRPRTVPAAPPLSAKWLAWLSRRLLRSRIAAAGFRLTAAMMGRDTELKMRNWPALSLPAGASMLVLLTGETADPMTGRNLEGFPALAIVALLVATVPVILHNLQYSRDYQASWILQMAPLDRRSHFAGGVARAFLVRLYLPLMILYCILLAIVWRNPLHAAIQAVLGWLVLEAAAQAAIEYVFEMPPFGRPPVQGSSMGSITLVGMAFGSAAMLLLLVQCLASPDPRWLAVYGAGLVLLVVFLLPRLRSSRNRPAAERV